VVGPTVEIQRNIKHSDFKKYHQFIEEHSDLEDNYDRLHEPGDKLILFVDGMNGEYLRLTYVQKITENAHIDNGSNMVELNTPIDAEVISKMKEIYQEYTGEMFDESLIKYAMWTQWT
jgi:hypothetical protein